MKGSPKLGWEASVLFFILASFQLFINSQIDVSPVMESSTFS